MEVFRGAKLPLLSARYTLYPETPTGEFKGALQLRSTECCAAVAVPLRLTSAVLPEVELLVMVSCPVDVPAATGVKTTVSFTAMVGLRVTGNVRPEIVNPEPVMLALLTVTGALPVDVKVRTWVADDSITILPKSRLVALIVSTGFETLTPVPLRDTVAVAFEDESLVTTKLPIAAPATVGVKVICKFKAWPGSSLRGTVIAAVENPEPLTDTPLRVTGPVPVDLSEMASVAVLFTVTLPKLRLVALTVSCGTGAATPVPLRLTVAGLALLLMVRVPAEAPAVLGSNVTCNVREDPGFSDTGNVLPDTA
jgi:hypothetical protein